MTETTEYLQRFVTGEDATSPPLSSNDTASYDVTRVYLFTLADYCVFGATLALSALMGLYLGCRTYFKGKSKAKVAGNDVKVKGYLTGDRKLSPLPVAMSLVASYISGVTILGTPSEVYLYGTQYWLIAVAIWMMGLAVATVFLPVFSVLQVHSSYEYLEMRFNGSVRTLASILFVIDEILFLPIVIYVPALAFNQVTGVDVHVIGSVVCVVCIFYTVLGGLRAVVWSDTWQTLVMFCSVVFVAVAGTAQLGGPSVVWSRAQEGGRLALFNTNPSLYERHTFWSVLIGGFMYWTSFNAVNQTMVQRYMSLPDLREAKISVAIFTLGVSAFVSVCCYSGLVVYAAYWHCDPLASGTIHAADQLLPSYVMATVGHLKGVPGLFIAGVFGAALSSLSVILHCTSGVLLTDILRGWLKVPVSDRAASWLVRGSAVVLGSAAVASLYLVEHLGGVLGLATSLSAIAAGTTFGVFCLGMLFPWSNSKGALWGALCGALASGWVSIGSQIQGAVQALLPVSVSGCANVTLKMTEELYDRNPNVTDVFPLYRLSYHWINPIGVFTVLIVGLAVSFLTGPLNPKDIDPDLISPVLHRFLPAESFRNSGKSRKNKRRTDLVQIFIKPGEETIDLKTNTLLLDPSCDNT